MKKNKKLILAFIVAILITSGLIGGYFIVNKDKNTSLINEISASSLNTSDDDIDWTSYKTYQVSGWQRETLHHSRLPEKL